MQAYILYALALASAMVQATPSASHSKAAHSKAAHSKASATGKAIPSAVPAGPKNVEIGNMTFSVPIKMGKLDDNGNKVDSVEKRDGPGKVSSCGKEWTPIYNFVCDGRVYIGYKTAVLAFCNSITADADGQPTIVGPGAYAGGTVTQDIAGEHVGLDQGKDPSDYGVPGHIECESSAQVSHALPKLRLLTLPYPVEIHNKQKAGNHVPDLHTCQTYLMMMTNADAPGKNCYGAGHHDTKGGTWQVNGGSSDISYHALPNYN